MCMEGIVIDIWEKSSFFGSIGSQKCTKNTIFPQGGLLKPPLPHVGLIETNHFNHRRYWAKILRGPNSSGPSKLALCKLNHAFSSFLNPLLVPFLVALMGGLDFVFTENFPKSSFNLCKGQKAAVDGGAAGGTAGTAQTAGTAGSCNAYPAADSCRPLPCSAGMVVSKIFTS